MKLLRRIIKTKGTRDCLHHDVSESSLHGLERIVCLECGHVTISDAEPIVTEARPARHRY